MEYVYITKAALKLGKIRVILADHINEETGNAYYSLDGVKMLKYHPGEWHRTKEDALATVEKMRIEQIEKNNKQILSLKKENESLREMKIEVEDSIETE